MKKQIGWAIAMLAAGWTGTAAAGPDARLTGIITKNHPYLYTDAAGFAKLKEQLPIISALPESGSVTFTFIPRKARSGDTQRLIFGNNSEPGGFFLRHTSVETADMASLQFGINGNGGAVVFPARFDESITIRAEWKKGDAWLTLNADKPYEVTIPEKWTAASQQAFFSGREGEAFSAIDIKDNKNATLLHLGNLDASLNDAWRKLLAVAAVRHRELPTCGTAAAADSCNTATGSRGDIPSVAQVLALMYRMTGDHVYLTDAQTYADLLIKTSPIAGGEWSGTGRLAALAILYDWLFDVIGEDRRNSMALAIKKNLIAAPLPANPADAYIPPMMAGICGKYTEMLVDARPFACPNTIVFEGWNGVTGYSISDEYIGGHPIGNVAAATMGLLAIAKEHDEVAPMLETTAQHYDKGIWRAMRKIAVNGGHHQSWGYTASASPAERLLIWSTAFEKSPFPNEPWIDEMVYPYIYGYRGRGQLGAAAEFPASGDAFRVESWLATIGQMVRAAAVSAPVERGADTRTQEAAAYFYQNIVLATRARTENIGTGLATLLDRLYWPGPLAEVPAQLTLPKSRHFSTAGRVLTRDSWDFDKATLFEFKSTSFASINHQHLDQNSFTLFFKGPLAVDSGIYDDYGSTHWHNYYIRSIAHNTVTVRKPGEIFQIRKTGPLSNDGGQWFVNGQAPAPTIEQIAAPTATTAAGSNYLHGVEAFENDDSSFSYVRGNASASYIKDKLETTNGFIRSSVFLQPTGAWNRPVVIVYDQVRTKDGLVPKFLLHTNEEPAAAATQKATLDGRYSLTFEDKKHVFTVTNVNSGAMAVETLLPVQATFTKVGGMSATNPCKQVIDKQANVISGPDCRFTAPFEIASGQFEWRNYSPTFNDTKGVPRTDLRVSDMGAWRMEIEPLAAAPTAEFLHVFTVRDAQEDGGVTPVAADRIGADALTEALRIGTGDGSLVVAFNKGATPVSTMSWRGTALRGFIATGLAPKRYFSVKADAASGKVVLQTVSGAGTDTYLSSDQGVIHVK